MPNHVVCFLLCMLLASCGVPEQRAPVPSTRTQLYPAPLVTAYPPPATLPSYPGPTPVPELNVTVIVDLSPSRLGIVYTHSLQILAVDADSPAAHGMLQAGDRIVKVTDHVVTTPQQFQEILEPLLDRVPFTITIERQGAMLQQTIDPQWHPEAENTPYSRSTATPVPPELYYR